VLIPRHDVENPKASLVLADCGVARAGTTKMRKIWFINLNCSCDAHLPSMDVQTNNLTQKDMMHQIEANNHEFQQ
jgi:hypothetical protein